MSSQTNRTVLTRRPAEIVAISKAANPSPRVSRNQRSTTTKPALSPTMTEKINEPTMASAVAVLLGRRRDLETANSISRCLQPRHLLSALARSTPEVVLSLHSGPKVRARAKRLRKPQGHLGGNTGAAVQDARKRDAADPQMASSFNDWPFAKILAQHSSGMRRVVHPHSRMLAPS